MYTQTMMGQNYTARMTQTHTSRNTQRHTSKRLKPILILYAVCWTIGIGLMIHLWGNVVSADTKQQSYVVKPGDTVWSIAAKLHTGQDPRALVDEIIDMNHLGSADVYPGETLMVPNS